MSDTRPTFCWHVARKQKLKSVSLIFDKNEKLVRDTFKNSKIFANNFNIKFRNGKIGWHLWYNFYAGHINDLINLLILQTTYSVRKASLFMTFITHLWCCGAVYSKLWIWALIGWIWGGGGRNQPPHHAPPQTGGQCKSSLVILFIDLSSHWLELRRRGAGPAASPRPSTNWRPM